MKRREMMTRCLRSAGIVTATLVVGGCLEEDGVAQPVTLSFKENNEFYAELERQLKKKAGVIVEFNGTDRIEDPKSRFLDVLKKAENGSEVLAKLHALDTEAGRQKLRSVFGPALLRHEPVSVRTKIGKDVVESGEIVLAAVAILSMAIGAAIIIQAVKYRMDIDGDVAGIFRFHCKPV